MSKIINALFLGILVCSFSILLIGCNEDTAEEALENGPYTIQGQIENPIDSGLVILSRFDPVTQKKTPLDTSQIDSSGNYSLSLSFQEPDLFRVDFFKKQYAMLVIDEGQNKITLDVEGKKNGTVSIEGSEDSKKLQGYETFRIESNSRLVSPTYAAMDSAKGNAELEVIAVANYAEASTQHRKELLDYTQENIGSSIALYGTMLRWTGDEEIARLSQLVQAFKTAHPDLKMTQTMEDKVRRYERVAIGAIVPSFSLPDTSGQIQESSEIFGKYTLLDFWASWCGPCLLQVPDLKEAYADYHDQGFEIVSISVDTRENKWEAAIEKYELNWPNVSDLQGWQSETAAAYNVTFVPFNLLIDEEGQIIAKNLHSKSLQRKLEGLFAAN